jgi:ADP-L-glycero-D-manno-heptose 6-epimerase
MNILLTGYKGFIGRNIEKRLVADGDEVHTIGEEFLLLDKDWRLNLHNFIVDADIDEVLHVGACSDTLETNVNYMMTLNYEFTVVLSDICHKYGIPLVYSSSAANTGTDGLQPANLYGWSKKAAEDYVVKNGQVALRYYNVYGPGEEDKGKMASVAFQSYKKMLSGEQVYLFPGRPSRDFVYIEDVVSANIFALENYHLLGKKYYHVGSGESRTFEDVMNILGIPYEYTSEDAVPKGYQYYTVSDRDKMMHGWRPKFKLEDGVSTYRKHLKNFFAKNEKM